MSTSFSFFLTLKMSKVDMLNCMHDRNNITRSCQKDTWRNKPTTRAITDGTRGTGSWTVMFVCFFSKISVTWPCYLCMFLCALNRKVQTCGSGPEPSLTAFTRVCKVLTFHVIQSVSQHLEHGHIKWVAECGVVEIGVGVSLQGRQRHLTAAQRPSSGPPFTFGWCLVK